MKNLLVQKHTGFLDEIIDWLERNWQVGTKRGISIKTLLARCHEKTHKVIRYRQPVRRQDKETFSTTPST